MTSFEIVAKFDLKVDDGPSPSDRQLAEAIEEHIQRSEFVVLVPQDRRKFPSPTSLLPASVAVEVRRHGGTGC